MGSQGATVSSEARRVDITFQLDGDPAAWEKMANDRHARFLLAYDAQRFAVLDRDVDASAASVIFAVERPHLPSAVDGAVQDRP